MWHIAIASFAWSLRFIHVSMGFDGLDTLIISKKV